jgi:hypothetical protein
MLFYILEKVVTADSSSSMFTGPLGYHHVPYPVELPSWLPQPVMDEMLQFFRPILVDLLNTMESVVLFAYQGKAHNSQESELNISTASTTHPVSHNINEYTMKNLPLPK